MAIEGEGPFRSEIARFTPVSPQQLLAQRLPRLPEVDQLENDQFIRSAPIVSQSITFSQFGASVAAAVGLGVTGLVDGRAGLREALAWKDVLRSFPVAACFSLSQTFTIMAYSAGVLSADFSLGGQRNGEHGVVGNVYLPLSALLSRWIFRRSYSFLEWIALTALMLSASVFVLLQQSPSGWGHKLTVGLMSLERGYYNQVCMSCLASMLSEKIMKAGSSPFYIQKVNLDIGSFITSVIMLFVCGMASERPNDAFWKSRDVDGRMEAGIFVAWDARMVYFVGDIWLNHVVFDWPVGTTALATRWSTRTAAQLNLVHWGCGILGSISVHVLMGGALFAVPEKLRAQVAYPAHEEGDFTSAAGSVAVVELQAIPALQQRHVMASRVALALLACWVWHCSRGPCSSRSPEGQAFARVARPGRNTKSIRPRRRTASLLADVEEEQETRSQPKRRPAKSVKKSLRVPLKGGCCKYRVQRHWRWQQMLDEPLGVYACCNDTGPPRYHALFVSEPGMQASWRVVNFPMSADEDDAKTLLQDKFTIYRARGQRGE
ncbi:hypothetical protein AK812_SmicGene20201 [Symbiodinium microadriaticum]|uniref:Uncharacterized protein n=1 Tax=Symbiodinium microadriaticum TaxID=2951 RepID=A0A1Q9DQM9_SYMMI|nr:hypothetical protein AK812_SmicGene20201 [Symbiodinium microadriaticum]